MVVNRSWLETGGWVVVVNRSWLATGGGRGGLYVVSQHEGSGLDDELVGLFVPDDGGREPGGAAGFAAGVDRPRREVHHVPEDGRGEDGNTEQKQRSRTIPPGESGISL